MNRLNPDAKRQMCADGQLVVRKLNLLLFRWRCNPTLGDVLEGVLLFRCKLTLGDALEGV